MTARLPFAVKGKTPQELIAEIRGLEGTCAAQDAAAQKATVALGKITLENSSLKKAENHVSAAMLELREDFRKVINEIPKLERRARIQSLKEIAKTFCRGCREDWKWASEEHRISHKTPHPNPLDAIICKTPNIIINTISDLEHKSATLTEEDIRTAFPEAYFRHGKPSDKIFVVTAGIYSDLMIDSVYRTQAEAEAKSRLVRDGVVEEMEFATLDVSSKKPTPIRPDISENISIWKIAFTLTGTILSAVKLGAYEKPPPEKYWIAKHPSYSNLIVYCRAPSVAQAQKIATDKRAAHLAGEAGIS